MAVRRVGLGAHDADRRGLGAFDECLCGTDEERRFHVRRIAAFAHAAERRALPVIANAGLVNTFGERHA